MQSDRRNSFLLVLGLGLGACLDDVASDGGESSDEDPDCQFEQIVDVHFDYDTASMLESHSCELVAFGPSPVVDGTTLVQTSCGHQIELEGVTPPMMELDVGDSVQLQTRVADPEAEALGCAEDGWLSIEDTLDRVQLVAMSVAETAAPLSLGDLGEVQLQETLSDGCRALLLRTEDEEVTIYPATSTEIELAGAELLVQMGPISPPSSVGCNIERYSLVMFRLPG